MIFKNRSCGCSHQGKILFSDVKLLLWDTQFSFFKRYAKTHQYNLTACIKMEILEQKQTFAENPLLFNDASDLQLLCVCVCVCVHPLSCFSRVWFFVTLAPWTVVYQAPPSMGSPGNKTRVGCHALLQGIFSPQDRTRISYVSCTARWVLHH